MTAYLLVSFGPSASGQPPHAERREVSQAIDRIEAEQAMDAA